MHGHAHDESYDCFFPFLLYFSLLYVFLYSVLTARGSTGVLSSRFEASGDDVRGRLCGRRENTTCVGREDREREREGEGVLDRLLTRKLCLTARLTRSRKTRYEREKKEKHEAKRKRRCNQNSLDLRRAPSATLLNFSFTGFLVDCTKRVVRAAVTRARALSLVTSKCKGDRIELGRCRVTSHWLVATNEVLLKFCNGSIYLLRK